MGRLLPCRLLGSPGTGIAPRQPGSNCTGLVPLSQLGPCPRAGQEPRLEVSSVSFIRILPTAEWGGQFPRPAHGPLDSRTASPRCWQVTVGQMLSACHLLGKPLGSLAMLCFGKKPPHPRIAWKLVNSYRNYDYKGDPESSLWAGGIAEDFVLSRQRQDLCQRQHLICCQTLRSLGQSLLWWPPWRTGSWR